MADDPVERVSAGSHWEIVPYASRRNLPFADWLFRSKWAGLLWLVARLWLGYEWLNAGYQKLWGSENPGFWNNGGAAVRGYAQSAVAESTAGKGGASYGWWAGFLHSFVMPNASWIGKLVGITEFLIGLLLLAGLLTGLAAAVGLTLNLIYLFSGTAGVNPAYAIVAILLIMAWRNGGYFGLDRFVFPFLQARFRRERPVGVRDTTPSPGPIPIPDRVATAVSVAPVPVRRTFD
jgi:thiosulfate dehydrogenase (quinone) large subunit